MKKVLMLLALLSMPAVAMQDFEVLDNVIKTVKCGMQGKEVAKPMAKFGETNRYGQWVEVHDARQISQIDFDFLIENKDGNGYKWIPANLFERVRCDRREESK